MNVVESAIQDANLSVDQAFEHYKSINFSDVETYGEWLAQTHYYVHHVTRILAFAASKCDLFKDRELHFRLIHSLNEEKNHDNMLLDDLKALNLKLENYPEMEATRNFYQALFYMVETYGPYALVGYFIPQEGLASLKLGGLYKELCGIYGESACTFLKEHCELDVEHFGEALEFLKAIEKEKLPVICLGMYRSAELYASLMQNIANRAETKKESNFWNYTGKTAVASLLTQSH